MDAIEYIRSNAEVSVGTKQIHKLEGIDRAITFSVTLFAPFDSYTGMESTWDAARLDELLAAQCGDSAPAGSGEVLVDARSAAGAHDGAYNINIGVIEQIAGAMPQCWEREALFHAALDLSVHLRALLRKLQQGADAPKESQ